MKLSIIALLWLTAAAAMHAQPITLDPYQSDEGASDAGAKAQTILGDGARLILIGALGDTTIQPQPGLNVALHYNPTNGASSAWAYYFRSASGNSTLTLVPLHIPFVGLQVIQTTPPVPTPSSLSELDTTGAYASSRTLPARLETNETYRQYRTSVPGAVPRLLALRDLTDSEREQLTGLLPVDHPAWALSFSDGERHMQCWVSTTTGEVVCQTDMATGVRGAWNADQPDNGIEVARRANGITVRARSVPSRDRAIVELFDVTGARVAVKTTVDRSDTDVVAFVDTSTLPAGAYVIRIRSGNWGATTTWMK